MYKQCQSKQSARRQRELELGLLQMMARKRFSEITVAELCEELKIPRKAFYRYFDNKEGALYALLDHTLMELEMVYMVFPNQNSPDSPADAQMCMEKLFRGWMAQRELFTALEYSGLVGVLTERAICFSDAHKTIPAFLQTDDSRMDSYGRTFISAGLMAILFQWHCSNYQTSVEDMAKLALRLFREPLYR